MIRKRRRYLLLGGILSICLLAAADILTGKAGLDHEVVLHLRLPRVLTALLAGSGLALAGTQMQSIFRNPLADPHIMGVSAGASLGAALAVMAFGSISGWSSLTVSGAAFIGAAASAGIIMSVSGKFRSAASFLIFGIMLGFIVNAIVSILQFGSDSESLKIFYSWSAGSFSNTTWLQTGIMAAAVLTGFIITYRNRKGLDIILFGNEFAQMAGADTGSIRMSALAASCITTAAATAFCGPIGFVGIVAPHIARALMKTSSHSTIIPASIITGGIMSISADIISQIPETPLPTAGTMALIGIPIILVILIRKQSI